MLRSESKKKKSEKLQVPGINHEDIIPPIINYPYFAHFLGFFCCKIEIAEKIVTVNCFCVGLLTS